jgi:hypothetical protein
MSVDPCRAFVVLSAPLNTFEAARELIDVPYRLGGRMRSADDGIDCQGVLFYAVERLGRCGWRSYSVMPPESVAHAELGGRVSGLDPVSSVELDIGSLEPGDIVLLVGFEPNPKESPVGLIDMQPVWVWHTGIYAGEGASQSNVGDRAGDSRSSSRPFAAYIAGSAFTSWPRRTQPDTRRAG